MLTTVQNGAEAKPQTVGLILQATLLYFMRIKQQHTVPIKKKYSLRLEVLKFYCFITMNQRGFNGLL